MMRKIAAAILLLCTVACSTGRSLSSGTGGREAGAYYPLAVGNRWTYQTNLLGEKGERTVEIIKEEDGFFRDSQGGRLTVDGFGIRDDKRYLLRAPLKEGERWSNIVSANTTEHYTVLGADDHCESPAGVFEHCVRVEGRSRIGDGATLVNQLTFARGVGLVRIEVVVEQGGRQIPQSSLALSDFVVKPS
jgi:hypothetical protein